MTPDASTAGEFHDRAPSRQSVGVRAGLVRIGIINLTLTLALTQFERLLANSLAHLRNRDSRRLEICAVDLAPQLTGTEADWDTIASLDAVIVTGAIPQSGELTRDPAFGLVERIIAVTEPRAVSVIFSCLSSHAALRHLHSLPRRRLPRKRVGVLRHRVSSGASPLVDGLPEVVAMPHSHEYTVDTEALGTAALTPLLLTHDDEWALAADGDGIRHIFLQGHPEYFADTPFREYRRDVRRFLQRDCDDYPEIPPGYFSTDMANRLEDFSRLARQHRSTETLARFPDAVENTVATQEWLPSATTFATNWMNEILRLADLRTPGQFAD